MFASSRPARRRSGCRTATDPVCTPKPSSPSSKLGLGEASEWRRRLERPPTPSRFLLLQQQSQDLARRRSVLGAERDCHPQLDRPALREREVTRRRRPENVNVKMPALFATTFLLWISISRTRTSTPYRPLRAASVCPSPCRTGDRDGQVLPGARPRSCRVGWRLTLNALLDARGGSGGTAQRNGLKTLPVGRETAATTVNGPLTGPLVVTTAVSGCPPFGGLDINRWPLVLAGRFSVESAPAVPAMLMFVTVTPLAPNAKSRYYRRARRDRDDQRVGESAVTALSLRGSPRSRLRPPPPNSRGIIGAATSAPTVKVQEPVHALPLSPGSVLDISLSSRSGLHEPLG